MFETAKSELISQGYSATYRIVKNREGTIDAELVVAPERGQGVRDTITDMELATSPVTEFWMSVGARYDPLPKDEEKLYVRWKGMTQTHSQYYPATKGKKTARSMSGKGKKGSERMMQHAFEAGREIGDRMASRKRRKKASEVILQFHWNPEVNKPKRYE